MSPPVMGALTPSPTPERHHVLVASPLQAGRRRARVLDRLAHRGDRRIEVVGERAQGHVCADEGLGVLGANLSGRPRGPSSRPSAVVEAEAAGHTGQDHEVGFAQSLLALVARLHASGTAVSKKSPAAASRGDGGRGGPRRAPTVDVRGRDYLCGTCRHVSVDSRYIHASSVKWSRSIPPPNITKDRVLPSQVHACHARASGVASGDISSQVLAS
jgi:hypothetical protein